jgi:hypothetical protein
MMLAVIMLFGSPRHFLLTSILFFLSLPWMVVLLFLPFVFPRLIGGMDGTLLFWNLGANGSDEPATRIPYAHDMAIWDLQWHPAGHMLATGSNDRQTKFWARNRVGSTAGLQDSSDDQEEELQTAEIELGNHVGIVIGRRGATIISMQRATGTKMYVDQVRRVLLIQKRVGALLDRVSNEEGRDTMAMM